MKKLLIYFALISFSLAGVINIQKACPPQKLHISVSIQGGKKVIESNISNPKNGDKLEFSFNPSSEYNYKIESFPPSSVCSFKGARGNKLPANPDIECLCIQNIDNNQSSAINVKPGKWVLSSKLIFDTPMPAIPPEPTKTVCVKDPNSFFSVEKLGAILAKDCPYIMKKQSYEFGEWKRLGAHNCDIHGTVKYLGDRIKEKIRYTSHSATSPSSTIYINGKWVGDCKK